jgi:hypothetical protein
MTLKPGQVICIDRRRDEHPVKPRQLVFVDSFARGCNGVLMSAEQAKLTDPSHPWCIRGMKFTETIQWAWQNSRTFYYIDNGYFGNQAKKNYFRIIKNHAHNIDLIVERPRDRLPELQLKPFSPGRKIVVAPPSTKSFTLWNIDQQQWIDQTVAAIQQHTDRPIEIRLKRNREERFKEDTMEQCLADDVHCLVTYNSVAAVEAVMLGKPAITLGPNAAAALCSQSLSEIETPKIPTLDEVLYWARHIAYCQFTEVEMRDGTAWKILNDH